MKQQPSVISAIVKELELRQDFIGSDLVETIYFGGGTPSLLHKDEIERLLAALKAAFQVADDAEITLEANPDDLGPSKLEMLKSAGINRLSIGVQSFREADLQMMNRAHSADQSSSCLRNAQAAGFDNITMDLIYGVPGLSNKEWQENLETFFEFEIPHLSAYALTVEPSTALHHFVKTGKYPAPDEEASAQQFEMLSRLCTAKGYEHYEISNLALPGYRSKHNGNYWKGLKYLGLGPSAHSFDGRSQRSWNVANNAGYVRALSAGEACFESEDLTLEDRFNEYLMTGLRTEAGIDLEWIEQEFGTVWLQDLLEAAVVPIRDGLVLGKKNALKLSLQGKFVSDGLIADLFRIAEES